MKNKNKKFLFFFKRRNKESREVLNVFVASILIVTITSSFFSFLDKSITEKINNNLENSNKDNSTVTLPTTEEIINKMFAVSDVSAANLNYKVGPTITNSKLSLNVEKGNTVKYVVKYKNTGNYVLRKDGNNQVVLRVKGNKSGALKTDSWISNSVVAYMKQSIVNVGQIAEFEITLKNTSETSIKENYVLFVKSYSEEISGSDIEITLVNKASTDVAASSTTSASSSTANVILTKSYKLYDESPEIKKLQQFLNNNNFIIATSGVGSKGKETSTFGPATVKALTAFQNKYNLKNAGSITEETISFINSFGVKSTSNTDVTSQSVSNTELKLETITYVSSDKNFDIVDSVNNNVVLSVNAQEKINVFYNQITKQYTISKNGLIYVNSKNKLNLKNTGSGTFDFGGSKNTSSLIALKSDFDNPVKNVSSGNGTVVCASVDCTLVDNNTNSNVVNNETSNIGGNTSGQSTGTAGVTTLNHQYIKNDFKIRVGLGADLLPATITNTQTYNLVDGDNLLITQVLSGEQVIINYNKTTKIYSVIKNGIVVKETFSYLKLQNINNGIFTIVNMVQSPYGVNYNMFKGDLELRYNTSYDKAWVINELSIEDYLKGIGEASNSSSYEYLKVMAVTARTYASYHYLNDAKNSKQYFNVFSTTADQVYYGYRREMSQPNVVRSVDETRGMYIVYNDKIIQAFYSANAGGKTRTLSETWGGSDLPYLQPVEDKYTKNDVRFGHGVGMSQVGAIRMIAYDNADFVKVLTYYYTGVQIKKLY